jgi:hypothetical protein
VTDGYDRDDRADEERPAAPRRNRSGASSDWGGGERANDRDEPWAEAEEDDSGETNRLGDRWDATDEPDTRDEWGQSADSDEAIGADEGRDRWSDGRERSAEPGDRAAAASASPWTPPPEPEDELRSFVQSEELPSEERMAAAELEAEREAARDAAERRTHATDEAGLEAAAESAPRGRRGTNGRSVDGRLARLHLKGGLIALARAELETMAGQVSLDLEALADLAEARWRSGDLLGAGEAAQAHLARGGDELIALVVAVEALTAQGRTIDARRLAAQVLDRTEGDLDPVFAGQPRAHLWSRPADVRGPAEEEEPAQAEEPTEPEPAVALGAPAWPDESRVTPLENIPPEERLSARLASESATSVWPAEDRPLEDRPSSAPGGLAGRITRDADATGEGLEPVSPEAASEPAPADEAAVVPASPGRVAERPARPPRPSPAVAARRELTAIEASLRQGRREPVTGRLALLLRTEPDLADRVAELSLVAIALAGGSDAEAANLYIVRGDALRVLGRSEEAELAYEQSRRALTPELAESFESEESFEAEETFESQQMLESADLVVAAEPYESPEPMEPADQGESAGPDASAGRDEWGRPLESPPLFESTEPFAAPEQFESEQPALFGNEATGLPAAGVSEPAESPLGALLEEPPLQTDAIEAAPDDAAPIVDEAAMPGASETEAEGETGDGDAEPDAADASTPLASDSEAQADAEGDAENAAKPKEAGE